MALFSRIRLQSNQFTSAQERIVRYLKENDKEALTLPINELAKRCQVGDATVIRFYRLLGYENYAMFRIALAQELSETDVRPIYEEVETKDGVSDVIRKVIDSTNQGISDLEKQISEVKLEEFADMLLRASTIHVLGLGASGVVAQDAMHKLMRLGCKIIAYSDSHLMTIAASIAKSDEVFFAVSHSGETTDIIRAIELAKQRGCKTCALTSSIGSSITQLVDVYLLSCKKKKKMRSDAMISRIVQLVVIDMLYVLMALEIGDSAMEGVNQSRLALKQCRNVNA